MQIGRRRLSAVRVFAVCSILIFLLPGDTVSAKDRTRVAERPQRSSSRVKQRSKPRSKTVVQKKKPAPLKYVSDEGDEVEGRQSWFMRQRTYPFRTLPSEARLRAWAARPAKAKNGFGIESATATVWSPIGPMPTRSYAPLFSNFGFNSGRINSIAVSTANPQIILVGASTGGIWRSSDGGATFIPASDAQVDLAVGAIAFAPSNPNIVYAGMGDMHSCCDYLGSGVLKSTDAGATWTRINNSSIPQPASVGDIQVDPTDPNKIYLALYRSLNSSSANNFPYGGVYVSTDGGVNWIKRLAGLPRDIAINPANSQIIYAAMRGIGTSGDGGVGGVYRSLDGGINWSVVYASSYPAAFAPSGQGIRDVRVAVTAANPQRVYVYSGAGSGSGGSIRFAVSNDGGANFSADTVLTTVDKGQFGYNTYLQADPLNGDTVYIGARDIYRSLNGGITWTNITRNFSASFSYNPSQANTHPDQHAIELFASDPNTFLIGNDGGLFRTTNGGQTFQSLNTTLSLTQFVSLVRHPTNPSVTYGGTQDNGTQRRSGTSEWEDVSSGDGGHLVINPLNPSMFFVTYVEGTIWRFDNGGAPPRTTVATDNTFKTDGGTNERVAFYAPLTGNGVTSQLYFGTQRVWTTTNLGGTWSPTGAPPDLTRGGSDVLSAIGVARANPNVIYTGSEQGRAMVSTNGGQTWGDANVGLPDRFITSIKVDYSNPALAYLTVSGFGSGHIFKTTNMGASWTDISGIIGQGGLPNIPANTLLIDLNNPNLLYAGTDVGVFRSTVGGTVWQSFNDGMPPVVVTALTANNAGEIQAGTYGRGAFEATIQAVPQTASLSGRVMDGFGNGVSAATVTLSGTQAATTTTDAGGNYSFTGLALGGNYNLSPSKSGQYLAFSRLLNNLSGDTAGFDLQVSRFITVNVHTVDSGGNNLGQVAVSLNNQLQPPQTNAFGNLTFTVPIPEVGEIQITLVPTKLGYAFNPASFSFGSSFGNRNLTFTAIPPNAIDNAQTFVTEHYRDFLGREPDQGGLAYWTSRITDCGTDQLCIHNRRIDVSAAFFIELEFQRTGSFVYRSYKGVLGRSPAYAEFSADRPLIVEGPNLEQTKQSYLLTFVQRAEFVAKYAGQNTAENFADALIASIQTNSQVNLIPIRGTLISQYNSGGADLNLSRAQAVRAAIDAGPSASNTMMSSPTMKPSS